MPCIWPFGFQPQFPDSQPDSIPAALTPVIQDCRLLPILGAYNSPLPLCSFELPGRKAPPYFQPRSASSNTHLSGAVPSPQRPTPSPFGREPNFFFVQVPPLHAALWQRRSEPVKGLRCASMNAKSRALDRTLRAPARRARHEAGALNKRNLV